MLMMLPSCLVKCMQSLGQLVLQRLASGTALWPEMYPADAHDAPLLPGQMHAIICNAWRLGRPCGRICTAHDAPLLPRQMHAITRAVGFATPGVWDGPVAGNVPS